MTITTEKKAYDHLRRKLALGALPPGSRVSAIAVAKEMGISATPVTQAIRRLEFEGLISLVPHLGTFVKKPSLHEIEELYDLRIALETHAISKAIPRLTAQDLAELEQSCQVLLDLLPHCQQLGQQPLDTETLARLALADLKFHTIIVHAAGNERIIKLMDDSHVLMRGMTMFAHDTGVKWAENVQSTYDLHRQMLDAILRRDRKAARQAVTKHLRDSIKVARAHFREAGDRRDTVASSVYDVLREAGEFDTLAPTTGKALRPQAPKPKEER